MQNQQKIRIKRKKIVIPARKRSKRDRLYAFLKKNSRKLLIIFTFLSLLGILIYGVSSEKTDVLTPPPTTKFPYPEILPKEIQHRNCTEEFVENTVNLRDFLKDKISDNDIRNEVIYQAKNDNNVSVIDKHNGFYIFLIDEKDKLSADFFVYQMAVDSFLTINLLPMVQVDIKTVTLDTKLKKISGKVNRSLADAILEESKILYKNIEVMENTELQTILNKQSIIESDVKINDEFSLIFEEKLHKDKSVAAGNILAVHYKRGDKEFYSFRYENDKGQINYFDENGNTAKRRFLPYPLQHSTITSPFGDRIHPIEKRHKPHHGTDYRAKEDEPVYAVGDGVVTRADSSKNNGNYVKLKHEGKYTTQYLHFNKIAEGIKRGGHVRQGDIIGYAGDTGKADGVHVCFRVKKGSVPIDHTKDPAFGENKMVKVRDLNSFEQHRDSLRLMLEK